MSNQAERNIAILVPSYNSTSTLEGTLKAILALDEELRAHIGLVMLSDDGSKDDTVALAESLWNHPVLPLTVRRVQPNGGEYRNVNGAFAAMPAHIEWVLIMHADNQPLPGWISLLARECARVDARTASICGSWADVLDGQTRYGGDPRGPDFIEDILGDTAAIRSTLFRGCWWHNSSAAIRVSAWKAVGGHPQETPLLNARQMLGLQAVPTHPARKLRIKGDWDTLLRMLSSGMTVRYIAHPLMRYIEVSTSVSAGSFAWHGDVLETMQVMRRHQAALGWFDLWRFHAQNLTFLLRRIARSLIRRDGSRLGYAIAALPSVFASLGLSLWRHLTGQRRRLAAIAFNAERSPP